MQSKASADEQVPEAELSAAVKAVDMLEAQAAAQKKNIQVTDLLEDSKGRSPILCFEAADFLAFPPNCTSVKKHGPSISVSQPTSDFSKPHVSLTLQ